MAEINLIICDNCASEFTLTSEAAASMTQVVITQGGSRSHVYDLCPNCALGFATKLADDPADWPRYVQREAVQAWLRTRSLADTLGLGPEEVEFLTGATRPEPSTAEKERREADGDFAHVWRPTEYGDANDPKEYGETDAEAGDAGEVPVREEARSVGVPPAPERPPAVHEVPAREPDEAGDEE